jgi:uncharacterized protein (UPF0332 family)
MMDGREFLTVADDLAVGENEADWRSAISRAYYAAFHVARAVLVQCGFDAPIGDQAHAYLWLRLSNCGHPDLEEVGRRLSRLRSLRNQADYQLAVSVEQPQAASYVLMATEIIETLDMAAAETGILVRITDGIKVYERDVLRQVTWRS